MHLEKNRNYACTFPVQRKEVDVVKVRFTMRYSSRKLSNDKVITTACNFWRQIACSFQVMIGNILFLGNKIFEIPPFFQTRPGDLGKKIHACSIRFSALKRWWPILKSLLPNFIPRGGLALPDFPGLLKKSSFKMADSQSKNSNESILFGGNIDQYSLGESA